MQTANEMSNLLKELDRGASLPASWYTDQAVFDKEIEKIFRSSWQYVGSTSELRNVGDFVTAYVGNVPVVCLRNERGIEAFVNVCRHRRHEVMTGCGNAKIMQCRYHAWTYGLDGNLKAAPRMERETDFRTDDYPLLSIRTDRLGPLVFITFNTDALPLKSYFRELLGIIADSGIDLDSLELYSRNPWESHSNWKTMLENFLECYHCAVAHPGFSAAIDVDQDSYRLNSHEWFFSQVGQVREALTKGQASKRAYDAKGEIEQAQYHLLWPNCTISLNPGFPNLSIDVWNPDGPNRSRGVSTQFFAPGVDKEWADELVAFNHQVGHEDDVLTDSVQRGLIGGLPEQGRLLLNSEHLIVAFQKLVVRALAD